MHTKFKSVLCLNGALPNKQKILNFCKNKTPLIAADGAANKLFLKKIIPDFIIGDLDSLDKKKISDSSKVIYIEDQDSTDFEKCLLHIKNENLFPTLVLGINGGEIDHIINNINTFISFSVQTPLFFYDSPNKWGIAISKKLTAHSEKDSTVSIFPFKKGTHLKSSGLHWELNSDKHTIFETPSVRNKSTDTKITINSTKDHVLLIIESKSFPF